jgi:hypothetical protein
VVVSILNFGIIGFVVQSHVWGTLKVPQTLILLIINDLQINDCSKRLLYYKADNAVKFYYGFSRPAFQLKSAWLKPFFISGTVSLP